MREDERGAAMLETALSAVVLLSFIFGILEVCLAVYSYHFISEAAREGARYAIVRGSTAGPACASFSSSYCNASGPNVTSYVKSINFPGINMANMTVTPNWFPYAKGTSCPASGVCNSPGNQVQVIVQYNFPLNIPFVPASTLAMSSTAAMIISQ